VVEINDNRGRLFPLVRLSDRSVVCIDDSLYEDGLQVKIDGAAALPPVAIGDVRPTDVLVLTLDALDLQGGVIPVSKALLPAGMSALWSFAEVLRRGCKAALDVQPDELQVGLQPARVRDLGTCRVFVADALEKRGWIRPRARKAREAQASAGRASRVTLRSASNLPPTASARSPALTV